jgi:hypothetical protein
VHGTPCTHLPCHPNACIEKFGRGLDAEAAALLGLEERNRLQRAEVRAMFV